MKLEQLSKALLLENHEHTIQTVDRLLKQLNIAADLIGGAAVVHYGYIRNTDDVDILITRDNYGRVADEGRSRNGPIAS